MQERSDRYYQSIAHVIIRTLTYYYNTLKPLSFELAGAIDDGLRKECGKLYPNSCYYSKKTKL